MENPAPSLAIIILAAGQSARMRRPKQLLSFQGKTLLQHILEKAIQLEDYPIFIVLGAFQDQIKPTIPKNDRVKVLVNKNWEKGMGGSVVTGLQGAMIDNPNLQKALFVLVDQPKIEAAFLNQLIELSVSNKAPVTATRYNEILGVPAIFDQIIFPELLKLKESAGARKIIKKYEAQASFLDQLEAAQDLDYPEDWEAFLKEINGGKAI